MAQRTSLDTIEGFLAKKRIAMVGVSREEKDFSVMLFKELCRRGYDVVPVNPGASEILGRQCFARVQDIQPSVEAALLMTSPAVSETVVRDCAVAGVRLLWMYGAGVQGAASPLALEYCLQKDIEVISGECPYMFFPKAGWHRLHGLVRRMVGTYPRRAGSPVG